MRIGVDARVLMDKYYSGVSEYTANLLEALLAQDKKSEYHFFYNSFHNLDERFRPWQKEQTRIFKTAWPNKIFNYFLQKPLAWPKLDRVIGGADVFWSPHFNFTSLSSGQKKIITVHDLSFLRYPEFFSWRKNLWHRALNVKKQLRAANQIIAVSENTKQDIIDLVDIAPEKIRVIYSGNNLIKREVSDAEALEFLQQHGLSSGKTNRKNSPFILYLGNIEPRKNITGLIKAFDILREEDASGKKELSNLKLVLAGADGWKNKKIYAAWKNSPYQQDIKFLGYISKKDKEVLYSRASVFAYPSYYEGFGFPPLEALTYGLPVVCSNVSSLPEVVGDAAIMINPFEISEIAQALKVVLTDKIVKQNLIQRGYERAKLFSWDKAAREYLQVFQNIHER